MNKTFTESPSISKILKLSHACNSYKNNKNSAKNPQELHKLHWNHKITRNDQVYVILVIQKTIQMIMILAIHVSYSSAFYILSSSANI